MSRYTRRSILKLSGSVLGGIAVGSTVAVAASEDRYLVDAKHVTAADAREEGLDIVHDLTHAIDMLVVRGAESDVAALNTDYVPDMRYSLNQPLADQAPISVNETDATNEPLYGLQWDKHAQNIPEAHQVTRGEDTRVTVIDTGVAAGHPDLQHAVNEELSQDFTGDGYGAGAPIGGYHGTHVAGIIAANDQNEEGVAGSAPATEVVDCRVFSPGALAAFADIIAAIIYSADIGADAANMSIGDYPVSRQGFGDFYGKTLNRTTSYANKKDTLLVASAGNAGADLQHDGRVCVENEDGEIECFPAISLPNEAANTMSISATGPIGFNWGDEGLEEEPESPAFYTNYGTNAINLAAPGGDADLETDNPNYFYDLVLSTIAEPVFDDDGDYIGATYGYGWAAGTSMAAPQVTGAAALVSSQARRNNSNQVRAILERTAERVDGYDKTYYGSGFLNPVDAVQ